MISSSPRHVTFGQPRLKNPRRFWLNTNDLVRVRTGEQYFKNIKHDLIHVVGSFNDKTTIFLIDLGATNNFLSVDTAKRLNLVLFDGEK